jgi:hypothetical protein
MLEQSFSRPVSGHLRFGPQWVRSSVHFPRKLSLMSLVDFLPGALITAPFAFVGGAVVTITQKYRPVNFFGWIMTIVGFGLISTLREDSAVGKWVGYQVVAAIGTGLLVCFSPFQPPLRFHSSGI